MGTWAHVWAKDPARPPTMPLTTSPSERFASLGRRSLPVLIWKFSDLPHKAGMHVLELPVNGGGRSSPIRSHCIGVDAVQASLLAARVGWGPAPPRCQTTKASSGGPPTTSDSPRRVLADQSTPAIVTGCANSSGPSRPISPAIVPCSSSRLRTAFTFEVVVPTSEVGCSFRVDVRARGRFDS